MSATCKVHGWAKCPLCRTTGALKTKAEERLIAALLHTDHDVYNLCDYEASKIDKLISAVAYERKRGPR
jgi:hypothetical protein